MCVEKKRWKHHTLVFQNSSVAIVGVGTTDQPSHRNFTHDKLTQVLPIIHIHTNTTMIQHQRLLNMDNSTVPCEEQF
jgi:hypothetical protein